MAIVIVGPSTLQWVHPHKVRIPAMVNLPQYGNCKEILKAKGGPFNCG